MKHIAVIAGYEYRFIEMFSWYGNINYLSYSGRDSNALRFESPDTAGELLGSWDNGDFQQLRIEA